MKRNGRSKTPRRGSKKKKGSKKASKKRRSIKWKTIPKKTVNKVAPVNINISRTGSSAKFRTKSIKNGLIVQHKELLQSITGSIAFNGGADTTYQLNPGLQDCFPWLANIAQNYEQYVFNKLSWEYVPRCPSNTAGTIYMATSYDAKDYPPFDTAEKMGSYRNSISSGVWAPVWHHSAVKKGKYQQKTMVRTTAIDAGEDIREYDIGNFEFALEGCANTNQVGQLWVHYSVTLFNPKVAGGLPVAGVAVFDEQGSPSCPPSSFMGEFKGGDTKVRQEPTADPGRVDSNNIPIPKIFNHHPAADPSPLLSRLSMAIPGQYVACGSAISASPGSSNFESPALIGNDLIPIASQSGFGADATGLYPWTAFMTYVYAATAASWLAFTYSQIVVLNVNRWLHYANVMNSLLTPSTFSLRNIKKFKLTFTPAGRRRIDELFRRGILGSAERDYLQSCPDYEDEYGSISPGRDLGPLTADERKLAVGPFSRERKIEHSRQDSQLIDDDNDEIEPGLVKVKKPDEPPKAAPAVVVVSGQSRSRSQDPPKRSS